MVQNYLAEAIDNQQLPADFAQTLTQWYLPLAAELASCAQGRRHPLLVGVQGTQGSGKSTLAEFLRLILTVEYQLRVLVLSIDDLYLTRAERTQLATSVHPLLITRGVPGTHDIGLALDLLDQLKGLEEGQRLAIPRFNKALDDRFPVENWDSIDGPVDMIILEGWCVGLTSEPQARLQQPVNSLEQEEDPEGIWRNWVNRQLAGPYQQLFRRLEFLIVLSAPSFDSVLAWRQLQEQKLAERWAKQHPNEPARIQSPEQLARFIAHYQRLTQWALLSLPGQADVEFILSEDHQILDRCPEAAPWAGAAVNVNLAPDP